MTLPASGPISLSQVNTELGNSSSATISLGQSSVRTLFGIASGQIKMSDGYGKQNAIVLTVSTSVSNYNIFTSAGSPTAPKNVILNITSSGVIGGVGATALTVGQFPTGSAITINNSGSIIGFGGLAGTATTGGNGGDAIKADYPNQTVVINNTASAFIYGGGGGGGKGGAGGGGQFTTTYGLGPGSGTGGDCNSSCGSTYGQGFCVSGGCYPLFGEDGVTFGCNDCAGSYTTNTNGGTGGSGGQGQGYSQSNTNGLGGGAGGTNAGTGGAGGNGAVYGANGFTGSTGANGNRTSGSAGSSGGIAGRYLVKGANSVTLNNSGTVAGGLA